ncbi:hypothetical protein B481_1995 [Planococcus halocryophilus Or1]|uniref:Phage tail protein n=1 Tax=Planococcus halocryophilus TaxID=1215089 RepID=A0A1C7DPZ2_9BACL|nr:hypothetical protein [Planococcus halocryophilus]ANU13464.1 hypothetical protein BBI08_06240 [Planococcus halocryophilus]EMF46268.1 hypothetical protein B481_1995 [Planococcus halocryophilus Or1]
MNPEVRKIPFGQSNFIIGEGENIMKFDGKEQLQAEGGEVTLTPVFEDVNIADYGPAVYDKRFVGMETSVTIVAAEETINIMELAMGATTAITATDGGATVGLMDAAIGTSMRAKGKRVFIHPRQYADTYTDLDITIYKMIADGEYTRSAANEQGNVTVTLTGLPRDGMDPSKPGNFYYIGGTDPNAEVVA